MQWLKNNWHRLIVHIAGLLPLITVISDYVQDDPMVNRALMLRTGSLGLLLLVASFACTPVAIVSGWSKATQIRRALGLYGFLYIALHLLIYAVFENALELPLILRDIGERRAMLVGLAGFVLLIPLAITSTRGWQRRLGRRWRALHRLIYVAVPLAVLHYLLLDRDFIDVPVRYAVVVGILLVVRLPPIRRVITQSRRSQPGLRKSTGD
ncbi:MAG: sulfoxide reductase heme-binding subunit YedZ [Anaerolineae bacterium]|nr:sulfoxide reductase heme-binding subunit YedZ [Anaerolineae bacterium]